MSLNLYIYIYTAFIWILETAGKHLHLFHDRKKYHDRMRGKLMLYHQADVRVSRSSPPFLIDKRRRLGLFRWYPTPCLSVSFRLYSLRPTSIRFPLAFNSTIHLDLFLQRPKYHIQLSCPQSDILWMSWLILQS